MSGMLYGRQLHSPVIFSYAKKAEEPNSVFTDGSVRLVGERGGRKGRRGAEGKRRGERKGEGRRGRKEGREGGERREGREGGERREGREGRQRRKKGRRGGEEAKRRPVMLGELKRMITHIMAATISLLLGVQMVQ